MNSRHIVTTAIVSLMLLASAAGCGRKGDLVHPESVAAAPTEAPYSHRS